MRDLLSGQTSLISVNLAGTVVCVLGTGAVGDVATLTVDARVTAPAGSSLSAVVLVDSSTIDDHRGDNIATLEAVARAASPRSSTSADGGLRAWAQHLECPQDP